MNRIPEEKLMEKIISTTNLAKVDLNDKISKKLDELSGLISREGALHIIANELGVDLSIQSMGPLKAKELVPGMTNVEFLGKVLRIFDLVEFNRGETLGKVRSIVVADDTGYTRLVFWGDSVDMVSEYEVGDILHVKNVVSRQNQNRTDLHLVTGSEIIQNPEGVSLENVVKFQTTSKLKKIKLVSEEDRFVSCLGTVVQVYDPRFFYLCPECNKKLKDNGDAGFSCAVHGTISNPTSSCVVNFILDDGSGTIRTVCFGNLAEKVLDISLADAKKYEESQDLRNDMKKKLIGSIVKVNASVRKNELFNNLELRATDVNLSVDPEKEIVNLDALYVEE